MGTQPSIVSLVAAALTAVTLGGLFSTNAIADSRPQAVLDLIAAHQTMAMKVRPLNDRVLVAFKPDGVPIRAKVSAEKAESNDSAVTRAPAPERLRHKDRAASSSDEYGRIKVRLSAFEKDAKTERERVNTPRFGIGLSKRHKDIIAAQRKLASLQREFAVLEREVNALAR
jgi:hypothetical protein